MRLRVMTCNIRTSLGNDGEDHWSHRRDFCANVIRGEEPDLVGLQEAQRDQFDDLVGALPEFDAWGMVDEAHTDSPVNALFVRRSRFRILSRGGFWLSETPHVTGSRSWDSACVRLANWVRLVDRETRVDLRFVNTHLDHVSQPARQQQAALIGQDAAAYADDYPQLLTGDMNCDGTNPAIDAFRAAGWTDTHEALHGAGNPDTFHGFRGDAYGPSGKIDWIFCRGAVRPVESRILRREREGHFMSDHDFLCADVELLVS